VRKRRKNPASLPRLSLLDLMRDARCVLSISSRYMTLSSLIPPECPHGTATIIMHAAYFKYDFSRRFWKWLFTTPGGKTHFPRKPHFMCDPHNLAGWQVAEADPTPKYGARIPEIRLAPKPEDDPAGLETSHMRPCTFSLLADLTSETFQTLNPALSTSHQVGGAFLKQRPCHGPGCPDQGGGRTFPLEANPRNPKP